VLQTNVLRTNVLQTNVLLTNALQTSAPQTSTPQKISVQQTRMRQTKMRQTNEQKTEARKTNVRQPKELFRVPRLRLSKGVLLTALSPFILINSIHAAPLGLPKSTAKIGYAVGAAYVSVDDPQTSKTDEWASQPLSLIYTDWMVTDIRYWASLYYLKANLDATNKSAGQDAERFGVRFSLEKSIRLTQAWAPWFGIGIDVSKAEYSVRHTIDEEGFLLETFPDRSETTAAVVFSALSEWSLARDWSVGLKLEQSVPVTGDISEFLTSVAVLYRY